VLKGSYTAIFVSVLLHLLLLAVLIYSSINSPKTIKQVKPKVTSIKSFLYKAPKIIAKKVVVNKPTTKAAQQAKKIDTLPAKSVPEALQKQSRKEIHKTTPSKQITKPTPAQIEAIKKPRDVTASKIQPAKKTSIDLRGNNSLSNFSSYDRLSHLRQELNQQQRDKAFAELTQKRSASVMDAEQIPVPKSLVPLTREQKYQQNTSKSHVGSITKNDNGTCTIHREQMLGSPVEATTSSFACGENKFDKSFREHMQKVQAKLGQ